MRSVSWVQVGVMTSAQNASKLALEEDRDGGVGMRAYVDELYEVMMPGYEMMPTKRMTRTMTVAWLDAHRRPWW